MNFKPSLQFRGLRRTLEERRDLGQARRVHHSERGPCADHDVCWDHGACVYFDRGQFPVLVRPSLHTLGLLTASSSSSLVPRARPLLLLPLPCLHPQLLFLFD